MVQVRVHQPVNTDGSINLEAWLDHVVSVDSALDRKALKEACDFAQEVEKKGNPAKHSGPTVRPASRRVWRSPKSSPTSSSTGIPWWLR